MPAAKLNLSIDQGADFSKTLVWKDAKRRPINLTGYTARMQIRPNVSSDTVLADLSTENGKIVITPISGTITFQLSAAETQTLTSGVYDMEVIDAGGKVKRLIEGKVTVVPGVTR